MKKQLSVLLAASLLLAGCKASGVHDPAPPPSEYPQEEVAAWNYYSGSVGDASYYAFSSGGMESRIAPEENKTNIHGETEPAAPAGVPLRPLICTVITSHDRTEDAADGTRLFEGKFYTANTATGKTITDAFLQEQMELLLEQYQTDADQILEDAQTLYDQIAANPEKGSGEDGTVYFPFAKYVYLSTARQDASVLSLVSTDITYLGGVHPWTTQTGYNYDLITKKVLALEDILLTGTKSNLRRLVLEALEEQVSAAKALQQGELLFSDYESRVLNIFLGRAETDVHWYFSDKGLVIFFNEDEIAAYAAGIQTVELPYERLTQILKPQYLSTYTEESGGTICQTQGRSDAREIALAFGGADGGGTWQHILTAEGTVHNVQMYAVNSWLAEDTPILGNMIFSANRLDEDSQIRIVSSAKGSGVYLLRYMDGNNTRTATLDADGLRTIVVKNVN